MKDLSIRLTETNGKVRIIEPIRDIEISSYGILINLCEDGLGTMGGWMSIGSDSVRSLEVGGFVVTRDPDSWRGLPEPEVA